MQNPVVLKRENIKLIIGDSRNILPTLTEKYTAVITDPIWPNAPEGMFELDCSPFELLRDTSIYFPDLANRAVIQIGSNSDPRFLNAIPNSMKFFRQVNLEYVIPSKLGRILYTHDVAYIYGLPPKSKKGHHLIPGKYIHHNAANKKVKFHPCARQIDHVRFLIKWFAEGGPVLDPFAGSLTTLLAAYIMKVPAVGIERNEQWALKGWERLMKLMDEPEFNFNPKQKDNEAK